jgi:hydrogenase small subunit
MIAAPFGLAITDKKTPEEVAAGLGKVIRPPVIWLAFQDCTGCTETLLRSSHPDLGDLIMNVISLEYHKTLMAGFGNAGPTSPRGGRRQILRQIHLRGGGLDSHP